MECRDDQAVRALQRARKIMDQEWIPAGVTREELVQDEQLAQLFDKLVAGGRSSNDVVAEWEHKTTEEILSEYAMPGPVLHIS